MPPCKYAPVKIYLNLRNGFEYAVMPHSTMLCDTAAWTILVVTYNHASSNLNLSDFRLRLSCLNHFSISQAIQQPHTCQKSN